MSGITRYTVASKMCWDEAKITPMSPHREAYRGYCVKEFKHRINHKVGDDPEELAHEYLLLADAVARFINTYVFVKDAEEETLT